MKILRAIFLFSSLACLSGLSIANVLKPETKKNTEKISQDFLDFATEFSDDDEGALELLAEDAEGNLIFEETAKPTVKDGTEPETQSSKQHLKMKHTFNQQNSSTSSSNFGGEKP